MRAQFQSPPPAGESGPLAADAFRTEPTGGFGTADAGGVWTVSGGSTNFAVANGSGAVTLGTAGTGRNAFLNAVSTAAFDGQVTVSPTRSPAAAAWRSPCRPAGEQQRLPGRIRGSLQRQGAVSLYLTRALNNTETNMAGPLAIAGLRVAANDPLVIRLKLDGSGPTVLTGKVWRASASRTGRLAADRQRFHGGPPDGGKRRPARTLSGSAAKVSGGDARR